MKRLRAIASVAAVTICLAFVVIACQKDDNGNSLFRRKNAIGLQVGIDNATRSSVAASNPFEIAEGHVTGNTRTAVPGRLR